MELNYLKMDQFTKDSGIIIRQRVKELLFTLMESITKVSGKIIWQMDLVNTTMPKVLYMKENGLITNKMDKVKR